MKRIRKGFKEVWVFIIIVSIGLVGATSWVAYDMGQTAKQREQLEKETSGWKEEVNSEFKYRYKYPSEIGWEIYSYKTDVNTQAFSDGQRMRGTGVNYIPCGVDCGLAFNISIYKKGSTSDPGDAWAQKQMQNKAAFKLISQTKVSQDGISGKRWEYQAASGEKTIFYHFNKDDYSYCITVNEKGTLPGTVDITQVGEKILQTLDFS